MSQEATATARKIVDLREEHRLLLTERLGGSAGNALTLLESLYWRPVVSVQHVAEVTGLAYANANNLVARFEEAGLLKESTGRKRNRRFVYQPYLDLFTDPKGSTEATQE